ncbi:WD repeat protein [Metarhizium rileyi]|uniref:Probable cytosolic iron-sulfur protein assembly protein 1 n=1 Tax=Metarhizium rileyi (strain RCEF 4871) TaxID=1649241 RepID=A0A162LTG5_METRR|nr:WD repeat protein [Metarhizium rileyi RCEF 4871]
MSTTATISLIRPFHPDLHERAWASIPHPTLPLIATAHAKSVTIFSLHTTSSHSTLTGGHTRSVRSVAWKPGLPPHKLCLVSGSFDATAGLWRWDGNSATSLGVAPDGIEVEITASGKRKGSDDDVDVDDDDGTIDADHKDWEFTLVLEGHDSEIKGCAFAPSGAYLATCSRDKSVWIWEDIGVSETDDEWETIAVLNEHEGDVKAVAWCPDVPGRNSRRQYSSDVLASASYDNSVRIWREDGDGEWVCVAVLEGHEGTVWGIEWEPRPNNDRFPRLLSYSADGTVRLWTLQEDVEGQEDGDGLGAASRSSLGGIPNTMRTSLREEWTCAAVLPIAHDRDVYSVTWSKDSGMVASTGRDGKVALYKEVYSPPVSTTTSGVHFESPSCSGGSAGLNALDTQPSVSTPSPTTWALLTVMSNSHGPFEVNHITWCRRYDTGSESRGEEEMLVTTGDDGIVRSWQVKVDVL